MTLCSGVSMNGFELPQNRNDLLRFTQAIKYDDHDSTLFIGDSLVIVEVGVCLIRFLKIKKIALDLIRFRVGVMPCVSSLIKTLASRRS